MLISNITNLESPIKQITQLQEVFQIFHNAEIILEKPQMKNIQV